MRQEIAYNPGATYFSIQVCVCVCMCLCVNSSARILSDISVILTCLPYALQRIRPPVLSLKQIHMFAQLLSKACFVYLRNGHHFYRTYTLLPLLLLLFLFLFYFILFFIQSRTICVCFNFSGRMMVVWVLFEHPKFFGGNS